MRARAPAKEQRRVGRSADWKADWTALQTEYGSVGLLEPRTVQSWECTLAQKTVEMSVFWWADVWAEKLELRLVAL